MVDQGVVDGNSLGDMFLHSGDQLTWDIFQLAFRQKAEKEEKWKYQRCCSIVWLFLLPVHHDDAVALKCVKVVAC